MTIMIARKTGRIRDAAGFVRTVKKGLTTADADAGIVRTHPHLWEPLTVDYPGPASADDRTVAELRADYEGACQTIAAMMAAAIGEGRGPIRGVVEDIADLRFERDALLRRIEETEAAAAADPDPADDAEPETAPDPDPTPEPKPAKKTAARHAKAKED